jgi:hypothetical protein
LTFSYQNYVTIDLVKFLEKVPDRVEMDAAATLMCSGLTSYNAVTGCEESIVSAKTVNGKDRSLRVQPSWVFQYQIFFHVILYHVLACLPNVKGNDA